MTRQVYFVLLLVATTIACSVPFSYADHSQTAYVKTTGAASHRNLRDSDKNSNKDTESIDADDEERARLSPVLSGLLSKKPTISSFLPREKLSKVVTVLHANPELLKHIKSNPRVQRVATDIQKDPKKLAWFEKIFGAKDSGKRLAIQVGGGLAAVVAIVAVILSLPHLIK